MSAPHSKHGARAATPPAVPEQVEIVYREIDGLHVFEAPQFAGLHAADADLRAAFDMIGDAVTAYMRSSPTDSVAYRPDVTFATFKHRLESSTRKDFDGYREARRVVVALLPDRTHREAHAHA
jgi:hypothetical protein